VDGGEDVLFFGQDERVKNFFKKISLWPVIDVVIFRMGAVEGHPNTIQPRIICALGTFSAQTLLKTEAKITAIRGKIYDLEGSK
jgi:hypothetical protein